MRQRPVGEVPPLDFILFSLGKSTPTVTYYNTSKSNCSGRINYTSQVGHKERYIAVAMYVQILQASGRSAASLLRIYCSRTTSYCWDERVVAHACYITYSTEQLGHSISCHSSRGKY